MAAKSKHGLVLRDFHDGDEQFKKDDAPEFEAGAYANYEHAGLIAAAPAPKPAPKQ